jgi:hypothetical protein
VSKRARDVCTSSWSRSEVRHRRHHTERYIIVQEVVRHWHQETRRWANASVRTLLFWRREAADGTPDYTTSPPQLKALLQVADEQLEEMVRRAQETLASGLIDAAAERSMRW